MMAPMLRLPMLPMLLSLLMMPAAAATAAVAADTAAAATVAAPPGATVDELLAIARQMSPEMAAAALATEAAVARVDAAGRLPEPMFTTEFKDIERRRGSARPDQLARIDYGIEQEFPLWGKLRLQKDVARAKARTARDLQRGTEQEIDARIKTVFARAFAAAEGWRLTGELLARVGTLATITGNRYAQGLGEQEDALRAEVERTRLRTEMLRFEAEQRQTRAQLNALVARPPEAPLAAPAALRPIPVDRLALAELLARAGRDSPAIAAAEGEIAAAEGDRELVRRSWYPDLTLGVTLQQYVDEDRRSPGYEAMIGLQLPLQWGLRAAEAREAAASLAAARRRRDAADVDVQGGIAQAFWALDGAHRIATMLRQVQLPQNRLAFQTALRAYEQGRTSLNSVLDTEQRLFETMLRLIAFEVESQTSLAEIERLLGGEL